MHALLALILVGVLWGAVTRMLARLLAVGENPAATDTPRDLRITKWAQIPANRPIGVFPDGRANLQARPGH